MYAHALRQFAVLPLSSSELLVFGHHLVLHSVAYRGFVMPGVSNTTGFPWQILQTLKESYLWIYFYVPPKF